MSSLFGGLTRKLGRGGRPLRIAYGRFFHEACAYSPLRTGVDVFERFGMPEGAELGERCMLRGEELQSFFPHAELTGFVQAARAAGNVETVPLISLMTVPSGPLTRACFNELLARLLDRVEAAGELDGVYLALHGSMEVDDLGEAPEAFILRTVRERIGPSAKLAVSYDLHANLSAGLVEHADVLIGYRTNPHWDLAPTGWRAGNRLIRTLRGQCTPVHAWRKLPMVLGGGVTIDFLNPMRQVFRYMRRLERDERVLSASLFMVHPFTSAPDLGWGVHVCTDGDAALADKLANDLADRAWAQRTVDLPPLYPVEQALDRARDSRWRKLGPITLVDTDDIVGAGAPGGNTHILKALSEDDRGLRTFIPIHDPEVLEAVWDVPAGAERTLTITGSPGYNMPPVAVNAIVQARHTNSFGRMVRLDIGRTHVVISDGAPLPIHPSYWRDLGLDPRKADCIVQKNFFHYRMYYAATSFQHLPVVTDGATSLQRVREGNYLTPTYPQVQLSDWRDGDKALRGMTNAARRVATSP
ncbi:MAG: M81 family metallopeptidase [Myxococcota bacterium]